jgi:hypothetical protein
MNPTDWLVVQLLKASDGTYIGDAPFMRPVAPTLWGLPVAVTPAMAAGVALVGAFRSASQTFRKGGIRVAATNSHQDFFVKNLVAIRAEERLALAVYRPGAFGEVTRGSHRHRNSQRAGCAFALGSRRKTAHHAATAETRPRSLCSRPADRGGPCGRVHDGDLQARAKPPATEAAEGGHLALSCAVTDCAYDRATLASEERSARRGEARARLLNPTAAVTLPARLPGW